MCQLAGASRAGFYRHLVEVEPDEEEMELRDAIQRIYLGHRRNYGYRRITVEPRDRSMLVNRKRVARLMHEDNLIAVSQRKYVVTTDSEHDFQVYLNLAARMQVTAVNQLWLADITYIRLRIADHGVGLLKHSGTDSRDTLCASAACCSRSRHIAPTLNSAPGPLCSTGGIWPNRPTAGGCFTLRQYFSPIRTYITMPRHCTKRSGRSSVCA